MLAICEFYFPQNQKLKKSVEFIAHEIFALYGIIIFNFLYSQNEWVKRGLAIIPTKYGIAFGPKFLDQGGALVLVYKDGSVLLSHGGMEMGQVLCASCKPFVPA